MDASISSSFTDEILEDFALLFKPSDENDSGNAQKMQEILRFLQQKFSGIEKRKISRSVLHGSSAKKTSLSFPDMDITIFVRGVSTSECRDVLEDYRKALNGEYETSLLKFQKGGKNVGQFKFKDLAFDLAVAPDYVLHTAQKPSSEQVEEQRNEVWKIISDMKSAHEYSLSLSESKTEFMRKQTSFVHTLVRLLKVWAENRSHLFDGKSKLKSICYELIAVHVGREVERKSCRGGKYYEGLKGCLDILKNIGTCDIFFEDYFKRSEIPGEMLRKPFIIDPVCKWRNQLADQFGHPLLKSADAAILSGEAERSLMKLNELMVTDNLRRVGKKAKNRAAVKRLRALFGVFLYVSSIPPQIKYRFRSRGSNGKFSKPKWRSLRTEGHHQEYSDKSIKYILLTVWNATSSVIVRHELALTNGLFYELLDSAFDTERYRSVPRPVKSFKSSNERQVLIEYKETIQYAKR